MDRVLLVGLLLGTVNLPGAAPSQESYCARRPASNRCCTERKDDCSVPIKDSLCYCDQFCNQHSSDSSDCCPDYQDTCRTVMLEPPAESCFFESANYPIGYTLTKKCLQCTCTRIPNGTEMTCVDTCRPPPSAHRRCHMGNRQFEIGERVLADECTECVCTKSINKRRSELQCSDICRRPTAIDSTQQHIVGCDYQGTTYAVGHKLQDGCHECICQVHGDRHAKMECVNICPGHSPQAPHPNIVHVVNSGHYGWRAYHYSFLIGKSLDEIYRQKTGVCRPGTAVLNPTVFGAHPFFKLREEFDARTEWPGWIQGIQDQLDQPNSWAFTTAEVFSDRMAVQTKGEERQALSAWNLMDCVQHRNKDCKSTSEAWRHVHQYGITTERCYSSWSNKAGKKCKVPTGPTSYTTQCPNGQREGYLYRMSLQYKVSSREDFIRMEIQLNGPVQAHLRVKPDFFYYESGVYRHVPKTLSMDHYSPDLYLAARIIGWGVDHARGTKYWLCTNSWGSQWGEGGYFRIVRGENEADIEANVIGVWPKSALVDAAAADREP